ncbi:MAG TPA: MurR/RpiR family transcriptional regulator [Sphaerochaeta sp.]|nr:MurR/RpiR family transcriptional regulator [Sphaerochaeta sp.]
MQEASAIYTIRTKYSSLSTKEKKIADFILAHPRESVNPSIEELAERIGISESTMVRFAKKLGYSGYQRFRIALARETIPAELQLFETEVQEGDDVVDVVFRHACATLEETHAKLNRAVIKEAAQLMTGCRSLLMMGLGGSNIVALDAYHKMIRTGLMCQYSGDYHMQLMLASQVGEGDVALLISHTGNGHDTLALAEELKANGCTLIIMTSNPRSPLAKTGDLVITVNAGRSSVVAESFSARIISLVLVDVLYVEILEMMGNRGVENLNKMRSVIAKRRI